MLLLECMVWLPWWDSGCLWPAFGGSQVGRVVNFGVGIRYLAAEGGKNNGTGEQNKRQRTTGVWKESGEDMNRFLQ